MNLIIGGNMCLTPMKIKSISPYAPKFQFIPCGHCDECRRTLKNSWSFRLGLEIQEAVKHGWKVGFVTLTYNEASIPVIPFECFLDGNQYEKVYCFDKNRVRKFIRNLRSRLNDDYGITGLIYMVGSEYGTKGTQRSHHHMLVCFPPKISAKDMHGLIKELWQDYGFVSPEEYIKKRAKEENFLVDLSHGALRAAKYVCKYVCKDIGFEKTVERYDFVNRKNQGVKVPKFNLFGVLEVDPDGSPVYETAYKVFLRCRPFHLQSRSLGWNYFKNMDDSQKLDVLSKGVKLFGEEKRKAIPVYIRNKLMFDNFYGYVGEKRFIRRYASNFLLNYADFIFNKKVCGLEKMFSKVGESSFWTSHGCGEKELENSRLALHNFFDGACLNYRDIAILYSTVYGVSRDFCYDHPDSVKLWLQRFVGDLDILHTKKKLNSLQYDFVCKNLDLIMFSLSHKSTSDSEITKKVVDYKQRKKGIK